MRFPVLHAAILLGLATGCAHHPKQTQATPAKPMAKGAPEYRALYTKPLTSLGAKYAQLTPAAQATVLAEVGSAQIVDVVKERKGEKVYFVVTFRESDIFPPLYVAPDGSILNPDLSMLLAAPKEVPAGSAGMVSLNDLPPEVQTALQQQAAGAEVESIYREMWGDHALYTITFKDEVHHPKLRLSEEGRLLHAVAPKQ